MGVRLAVKADAAYEAWEIAGTGGLYVIGTPGGSLSIWQPARDDNKLWVFASVQRRHASAIFRDSCSVCVYYQHGL